MKQKIIITTGGTGGHVFPALAFAHKMKDIYEVHFVVDKRGFQYIKEYQTEYNIHVVSAMGLQSKNLMFLVKFILVLLKGILQSLRIFIKIKPSVVISFGSYATFSTVFNAVIFRTPILLHEQNSYLGKSHRFFLKYAKQLAISFQNTKNIPDQYKSKVVYTGLPVREAILTLSKQEKIVNKKTTITILGGSQGASVLGVNIVKAFSKIDPKIKSNLQVYHQCRDEFVDLLKDKWHDTSIKANVASFFHDVEKLIFDSDLIISRSGAGTIFEVATIGRYALYIPFAKASNNHQYLNAMEAKSSFGATIIDEKDLNTDKILSFVNDFLINKGHYNSITKKYTVDGIDNLVNLVKKYIKTSN